MKYCDICGTNNLRESNFCIHCGNNLIVENVCPYCGKVNGDGENFCTKCKKQIKPVAIFDYDALFSQYNEDTLLNFDLDDETYYEILSDIFKRAEYSRISGSSIKDKILNFANIFTECKTKSRGFERGFNLGSTIFYDDRLDDSVQIATIIHELSHYLLFDIVESLMCNIFEVKSTTTLQSFVWYFLTLPEFRIMNEYCAHTVEGRFIPYGYQNYGSFNMLVEHMEIEKEALDSMVTFGNTFANEIIVYLEKYIDADLRQEIKVQYHKDSNEPTYKSILTETEESWPLTFKNRMLLQILYDIFKEASEDDIKEQLEEIKKGIESTY